MPDIPGIFRSTKTRSGLKGADLFQALGAARGGGHLVVRPLEDGPAGVEHDLLVVDQQDAAGGGAHDPTSSAFPRGNSMVKVVPTPSSLSTVIVPPCSLTMPKLMAKPRPVPCPTSLVVKKGSKIRPRSSSRMPWPVSPQHELDHFPFQVEPGGHGQAPGAAHRLGGVDDEVHEHLLDLRRVDDGIGQAVGVVPDHLDVVEQGPVLHQREALLDDGAEVDRLLLRLLGPGEVEQAPDDGGAARGLGGDLLHRGALRVVGRQAAREAGGSRSRSPATGC